MKTSMTKTLALVVALGFSPMSFGAVELVKDSEITTACHSLGYNEGNAGYGKSMNGERIALRRF